MSRVICIAGESGSGKTTSMRNLDPKSTYYIDADKKGLSWKGWRKAYNKENKNYIRCDDANIVRVYIRKLAESQPHIKVIVVDTINGLMVADEMRRSKEKGYDKWVDLAACVWDLVCECYDYRDDLTIVFTAHTQTDHDENGYMFTRIKTSGKNWTRLCWRVSLPLYFCQNAWMAGTCSRRRPGTARRSHRWGRLILLRLRMISWKSLKHWRSFR